RLLGDGEGERLAGHRVLRADDLALEVVRGGHRVEGGRPALDGQPGGLPAGPAGEPRVGGVGAEHLPQVGRVGGGEDRPRDQVRDLLGQRGAVVVEVHLVGVVLAEVDVGRGHVDLALRAGGAVEVQAGGAVVAALRVQVELDGHRRADAGEAQAAAGAAQGAG